MLQPTLQSIQREPSSLYHTTLPVYITLATIIAFGSSIYAIYRRRRSSTQKIEVETPTRLKTSFQQLSITLF